MRFGIKGKQIIGVSSIVALAVVGLSAMHLASLARISLEESRARGELLANAIFHRAREVVGERRDPYAALRQDGGLRSILESSIYSKNVTYAAIVDAAGVVVAHSDPGREGQPIAEGGDLTELLTRSSAQQLDAIYSREGRTLEVRQPLLMGSAQFGSIRIGVSTLLIRREMDAALRTPIITAFIALLVAIAVSMLMAQLLLKPIHIIRTGLTRMGAGEQGVTLDLPQQDEFGELGTFFNVASARLQADRTALAGEKAHLESAVEHLEDAVALFNPEGELLFANPAMLTSLPDAPLGRPIDDTLPEGHPYRTIVESTLSSGESRGPTSELVPPASDDRTQDAPTGGERHIMTHIVKGRDHRMMGVMLVARNLSYLDHVRSMIHYSDKLVKLGELSAGVAHEVKNPLNAMMIHLELLRNKLSAARRVQIGAGEASLSAAAHASPTAGAAVVVAPQGNGLDMGASMEHVNIIGDEIRRLDQVLQGFLKFSRPEALNLQVIVPADLLDEVAQVVGPEAEKRGVSIVLQCPRDLPDLRGDSGMLRQAFLNLALNACQAMPSGGTLRITGTPASQRRIEVAFEDTGVGIEAKDLERIFNLYFTTKAQGSGIGLSMVFLIVQLHDGDIQVESVPGRGTKFRLLLQQA